MEKYIWSLDISTTNVGCSLWNDKGKLIELKHLALKTDKETSVDDRDICKADVFKEYCIVYKNRIENELNGEMTNIFVEAPLQNTPKNINTTALLLGFNGIARYVLYEVFNLMPFKISVYDSRYWLLSWWFFWRPWRLPMFLESPYPRYLSVRRTIAAYCFGCFCLR